MFVIRNIENGKYVARPGSMHSYTRSIANARVFDYRSDAENDLCPDNERVVEVKSVLSSKYGKTID